MILACIKSNAQTNHFVKKSEGLQIKNQVAWHPNPIYIRKDSLTAHKFQCWGTTPKGLRCKHVVKCDHCYCSQHLNQSDLPYELLYKTMPTYTLPKEGD